VNHFHTHVGNLARSRSSRNESPFFPRGRGFVPAGISRAQDRSRFLTRDHPIAANRPAGWRLSRGLHRARWCAPGGASKRARDPAQPLRPRVATPTGIHLQSWVQCVRVCSGPESCCERDRRGLECARQLGQCQLTLVARCSRGSSGVPRGNGTPKSASRLPLRCVVFGRRDAHLLGS